eukprot:scaffold192114_cov17-Tisochrysis_lutea.AAC.1
MGKGRVRREVVVPGVVRWRIQGSAWRLDSERCRGCISAARWCPHPQVKPGDACVESLSSGCCLLHSTHASLGMVFLQHCRHPGWRAERRVSIQHTPHLAWEPFNTHDPLAGLPFPGQKAATWYISAPPAPFQELEGAVLWDKGRIGTKGERRIGTKGECHLKAT